MGKIDDCSPIAGHALPTSTTILYWLGPMSNYRGGPYLLCLLAALSKRIGTPADRHLMNLTSLQGSKRDLTHPNLELPTVPPSVSGNRNPYPTRPLCNIHTVPVLSNPRSQLLLLYSKYCTNCKFAKTLTYILILTCKYNNNNIKNMLKFSKFPAPTHRATGVLGSFPRFDKIQI